MSQTQTISINGKLYDAVTGMPIAETDKAQGQQTTAHAATGSSHTTHQRPHSHGIHQKPQKSQTLHRRSIKKPAATARSTQTSYAQAPAPQRARSTVTRSPQISKFAPRPVMNDISRPVKKMPQDIGPVVHPAVQKAHEKTAQRTQSHVSTPQAAPKPSQVLKQEVLSQAIENAPKKHRRHKTKRRQPRFLSIASASFALLLLGGYMTYLNMPNLSVRVAASQAGIDASYPDYKPNGYRLRGPVAFNQNEVSMKFASNSGPHNFTISQSKSSWDSSSLLENYVIEKAGENYMIHNERGLTIYTYNGSAAWVNGGILYTIEGDAPLSGDQIRRIATSL